MLLSCYLSILFISSLLESQYELIGQSEEAAHTIYSATFYWALILYVIIEINGVKIVIFVQDPSMLEWMFLGDMFSIF